MAIGRGTRAVLSLVLLASVVACGKQGCTTYPVNSGIQVQVPAAIRKVVHTFRIELCQGQRCKAIDFASRSTDASEAIMKGVVIHGDAYDVDLTTLGAGWQPSTLSQLTVIGVARSGRQVLSHTEQFTFVSAYPNGKDCDPAPSLTYSASVGGADLKG